MKITLILACAGKGARAGFDKNKLLVESNGMPVFLQTFNAFKNCGLVDQFIVTANADDIDFIKTTLGADATVILGGSTRTQSVKNALSHVDGDVVLIHDGARPFVTKKIIQDCIATAVKNGSAIPVIPTRNTIIRKTENCAPEYVGKNGLYSVQTPQGFKTEYIKRAYAQIKDRTFNDDGEIYKEFVGDLSLYDGDAKNVKLTYAQDFELLSDKPTYRFGTGFDCHKLVENRKLILGGITIPHDKGLLGHSDADVLTHAIMDAILSSLSLRDIGYHFSDKDPQYKDADSMKLLARVLEMIKNQGYTVQSVSATIMAEKPKLLNHIPSITKNIAEALSIPPELVGLGATTLEGLGFVGREEGICVHATATLKQI